MKNENRITLFYDAACPVCALEMDHLRERDMRGLERRLAFIDIGTPGFDAASLGTTLAELNAEIHARLPDGRVIRGIEVLRLAYAAVGLGWVLKATAWAPVRPLFDRGYRLFARHRRVISRVTGPAITAVRKARAARTLRRMQACTNGACDLAASAHPAHGAAVASPSPIRADHPARS